jgi:hypothetical protein
MDLSGAVEQLGWGLSQHPVAARRHADDLRGIDSVEHRGRAVDELPQLAFEAGADDQP